MTRATAAGTNRYEWLLRIRPALLAVAIKALLRPRRVEVETPAGRLLVDPASNLGHRLLTEPAYEPWLEHELRTRLAEGSIFVDVGANEGYFTVLAARLVGTAGEVIAVEPQVRALGALAANVGLNGLTNVRAVAALLGSAEGTGTVHLAPSTNTGASGTRSPVRYPVRRQSARVMTLDALLAERACDLVKLDVEGSELDVLRGAPKALSEHRIGAIVVELHPRLLAARGDSAEELRGLLTSHGYRRGDGEGIYDVYLAPRSA